MAYIEWHDTLPDHFKTKRLASAIQAGKVQTVGHLGCLFAWMIRFRPGGIVEADVLEFAAEWDGAKGAFTAAMEQAGFLHHREDGKIEIHEWESYTRGYRKGRADALRHQKQPSSACQALDKRVSSGERNGTELNGTERGGGEAAAPPAPSDTISTLQGLLEPKPNGKASRGNAKNASDEIFRQMWALAKRVCIIGKDETLASYLRGWIAQKGGAEVERILSDPRCKGRAILDVQKWYFDGMVMKGD